MNFNLVEATQMLVVHGSRAYGMNTSTSDVDVKGFMLVPLASRFDIFDRIEQVDKPAGVMDVFLPYMTKEECEVAAAEKIEGVVYEFGKFLNLLLGFNPSMMDVLFCRDQEVRICKPMAERLRENRDMFLSRKAVTSYIAYAEGQLKRAQTHRGWLLNPPKSAPTREEFGLASTRIMTKDRIGAAERLIAIMENDGMTREEAVIELGMADVMEMLSKENAYRAARKNWDSYVEWSKHRNRERADAESKTGYDCYSADTEFLTESGWKLFDQITEDDKLATVFLNDGKNGNTVQKFFELEWQNYTHKFDADYRGSMIQITGSHVDVCVTPNHRMLFREVQRNTKVEFDWKLEEAAALPDCFDVLRSPTPKKKAYKTNSKLSKLRIPPLAFLTLMGWYLSDGTSCKDGREIRISQKKGGRLHQQMAKFANQYSEFCSLYSYERKPSSFNPNVHTEMVLSIRDREIADYLISECGKTKSKRIPRWVFELPKRSMDKLLNALHLGDGTVVKSNFDTRVYYSSLKNLADDVQELAMRCGYETSLYGPYSYGEDKNGYETPIYQVYINRDSSRFKRMVRSQNVEVLPPSTTRVVCFTVPNGTLIIRRNGRISIHGNCKNASHVVRLALMGKEIVMTGKVNVWRDDADFILSVRRGEWSYDQWTEWFYAIKKEIQAFDMNLCPLPEEPDYDGVRAFFAEEMSRHYGVDFLR